MRWDAILTWSTLLLYFTCCKEEERKALPYSLLSFQTQPRAANCVGRCSRGGLPGIPRACDRCDSSPDLWGFCHSARIWGFPFSLCRCEGQNHKPERRLQFLIGSGFPLFYEPVAFKSCLISILVSCLWPEGRRGKDRKSNCKAESLLSQVLMRSGMLSSLSPCYPPPRLLQIASTA